VGSRGSEDLSADPLGILESDITAASGGGGGGSGWGGGGGGGGELGCVFGFGDLCAENKHNSKPTSRTEAQTRAAFGADEDTHGGELEEEEEAGARSDLFMGGGGGAKARGSDLFRGSGSGAAVPRRVGEEEEEEDLLPDLFASE